MKIHYIPLLWACTLGTILSLSSCQKDEELNLVSYPTNQPFIFIEDTEGASTVDLNAVYQNDGTLALDGPVSRTYTFRFSASPEDATVTFELLNTNIPKDKVEITPEKVVIPAGYTDASVTVTLKDEDFSFAASNYDAMTCELGVRAVVDGFKIGTDPVESKVVIHKEAYVAKCSIVAEDGHTALFERAYFQGRIVNPEPIAYSFKMRLDKPARKDVKVKLITAGLDEKFVGNVSVTPAEIIIPAGQLFSEEVTWSVTDDFLLTTEETENHTLVVSASIESEDPVVAISKENSSLTFDIAKVFRTFGYVSEKLNTWNDLSKAGWTVSQMPGGYGNPSTLIDGRGGVSGNGVYTSGKSYWFIVDLQSEKSLDGLAFDYYQYGSPAAPREVAISTSLDNTTWTAQGKLATPQSATHNFQFFSPVKARYVKVEMFELYSSFLLITEFYAYGGQ